MNKNKEVRALLHPRYCPWSLDDVDYTHFFEFYFCDDLTMVFVCQWCGFKTDHQ